MRKDAEPTIGPINREAGITKKQSLTSVDDGIPVRQATKDLLETLKATPRTNGRHSINGRNIGSTFRS